MTCREQSHLGSYGEYRNSIHFHCCFTGNYNKIRGDSCTVVGNYNVVEGKSNRITGSYNEIYSQAEDSLTITGAHNKLNNRKYEASSSNHGKSISFSTPSGQFHNVNIANWVVGTWGDGLVQFGPSSHGPVNIFMDSAPSSEKKMAEEKKEPRLPPADPAEADPPPLEEGRPACIICCERSPCVVLQPCRHMVMCVTCTRKALAEEGSKCPKCRAVVQHAERIFIE